MDIERNLAHALDRKRGISNNSEFLRLIQAYWNKLRPKEKDFKDIYSWQTIAADLDELERLKKFFEDKGENAIVGETVIMDLIYELQLLAEDVEVFPTSDFDDIKRGIDFVLRFEDSGDFIYLGVDVKTTKNETKIAEYRERILKFLGRGNLGSLKYFEDEVTDKRGGLDLPMVVLAFNPADAVAMQNIMLKLKKKEKLTDAEKNNLTKVSRGVEEAIIDQVETIVAFLEVKRKQVPPKERSDSGFSKNLQKYKQILNKIKKGT